MSDLYALTTVPGPHSVPAAKASNKPKLSRRVSDIPAIELQQQVTNTLKDREHSNARPSAVKKRLRVFVAPGAQAAPVHAKGAADDSANPAPNKKKRGAMMVSKPFSFNDQDQAQPSCTESSNGTAFTIGAPPTAADKQRSFDAAAPPKPSARAGPLMRKTVARGINGEVLQASKPKQFVQKKNTSSKVGTVGSVRRAAENRKKAAELKVEPKSSVPLGLHGVPAHRQLPAKGAPAGKKTKKKKRRSKATEARDQRRGQAQDGPS